MMWNQEYFVMVSDAVTKRCQQSTNVVSGSGPLVVSTFPDNLVVVVLIVFL